MSSWRGLLIRIGDKSPEYHGSPDFEEHIETCYTVLSQELEHSEDDILSFLLQCAEQLPHKIPLYGTLVGLLNLENEEFVEKVVQQLQGNFQEALDVGDCNKVRILMRFLIVLMCNSVLQPGAVVEILDTLLSSAATTVDEEKGNPYWQARADFYIMCILSCLPWGGAELAEQAPEEIERVMAGIQSYFNIRRHAYDAEFSAFSLNDGNAADFHEKDFLEDLWDRIQSLSNNGWKVDSVPRPHLSFEARLVAGKSHDFGPISCPEQPVLPPSLSGVTSGKQKYEAEMNYPRRLGRLNIFPASKAEENMQPIDRFVVEEYLLDVLLFFNGCRKECAAYMVGLPVPFRYEYVIAEALFSQILLLPHPPFRPMYYTLVIIDLCKALPGAFPAVVAGAVRSLFEKIGDMDMECRNRLILWFSHHLSNFQCIWPWEEWSHVLELPKWAPQRVFVQEVLEREVRLSYWDKIKQSIENAPGLEELLPPVGGPLFKYSGDDKESTAELALSAELKSMVKGRKTARELISWIEEHVIPTCGPKVAIEVVVQTLLDIGAKSFTHLITVLERYGQVIARLAADQDQQILLIEEISAFWKNSAQMTSITIDRMMGYRLLSNLAIVTWVFSPANIQQFHTSDRPWEILRNAISKTCNRISDLRKEIAVLEKSVLSTKDAASKAVGELESAESRLEVVNGEPVQAETPGRLKRLKLYADKAKEEEVAVQESLEAKQALFARAYLENEAFFIELYRSFHDVLVKRMPKFSGDDQDLPKNENDDAMAVDSEEPSAVDANNHQKGQPRPRNLNLNGISNGYDVGEAEQWQRCVLGYAKSFTMQYAEEIWPHIEKLDSNVLVEDAHPLLVEAVYAGLRRQYR
ncbi:nuclear cap-binding protein subunit 1 [Nymphaea colorata]|nr:nuclear cap-binding protein subunit 1 [Nymphaea colorata]